MTARRPAQSSAHFGTGQASRIVGIPPHRLRRCVGAGLVRPGRDGRGRLRFGFVDLVLLRAMRGLLEKRVPGRQIGRVLRSLRRQIGERSLSRLNVYVDGERVVAWDGASRWQPDSGQFLFNFDAGRVVQGASKLAQLPSSVAPGRARGVSADDWCDLAIELEEDSQLEAREAYHRALDLEPDHVMAHLNLGRLLEDDDNLTGAEHHYRLAIATDPDNPHAWFHLGMVLERLTLLTEALYCHERAVQADPRLADAHYNLALLYERAGRQRDAVRHLAIYRRLIRRRP